MDSPKILRIARQIPSGSTQQRTRTDDVSLAVMVEPYRNLNQTLQKRLLRNRGSTPSVFEHFMGLEVGAAVEQSDSPKIEVRVHTLFCLKSYRVTPEDIQDFISQSAIDGRAYFRTSRTAAALTWMSAHL